MFIPGDENITRTDMTMLMPPATKTLRNKEVDWGPSNDISNISIKASTSSNLKIYLGQEHTLESRTTLLQEVEDGVWEVNHLEFEKATKQ